MKIDGIEYTVRELTMEEGFEIIGDGEIKIPELIRACVLIDGVAPEVGQLSMRVAQKLMPEVLRVNGMSEDAEGND